MKVWVVEHLDYEQSCIVGIWSTKEKALQGLKDQYPTPYIVKWDEMDNDLITCHFDTVPGYSIKSDSQFGFTEYDVDPVLKLD